MRARSPINAGRSSVSSRPIARLCSLAKAKRTRDEFYPSEALDPDKIVGLDAIVRDAVTLKYLSAPLSQTQLNELIVKSPP
jgi:hypothetical protein